jgi:hypothetical protein
MDFSGWSDGRRQRAMRGQQRLLRMPMGAAWTLEWALWFTAGLDAKYFTK